MNKIKDAEKNVMKLKISLIILIMLSGIVTAQKELVVDKEIIDLSSLIGYSEYITDLKKVPENITFNVENYLKTILGNNYPNITFRDGYISDLSGHFKENPKAYDRGWIITKYQFVYNLSNLKMGIINYPIKIDMDDYGQIINCNWPREWSTYANHFSERSDIQKTAMTWAKNNFIFNSDYEVDLVYNKAQNAICWVFRFSLEKTRNRETFRVVEIDWRRNKVVDDYSIQETKNH